MTLAATFDSANSRVQLSGSAIPILNGLPIYIDRQVPSGSWLGVRGAAPAYPNASTLAVDDYEFSPNVLNSYRMRTDALYDLFGRSTASGWGTSDSGDAYTTTGGTGTDYNVAAGVGTILQATQNVQRETSTAIAIDTDSYVDIAVSATVNGASIFGGWVARFNSAGPTFYWAALEFTASGTINAVIGKTVSGTRTVLSTVATGLSTTVARLYRLRFRVQSTSLFAKVWDPTVTTTEPGAWTTTVSDSSIPSNNGNGAHTFAATGNTNTTATVNYDNAHTADLSAINAMFTSLGTTSLTPTQAGAQLKFPLRPYLNEAITLCNWSDEVYPARGSIFQVLGRSLPIATTELRGSRQFTIFVVAADASAADALALDMSFGDIAFLQTPGAATYCGLARKSYPTQGYFQIGDVTFHRVADGRPEYLIGIPLTEVSAPDPSIPGSNGTWQGIVNNFATWTSLQANFATWQLVVEYIPSASSVIVG